jgi:hypothetical protein
MGALLLLGGLAVTLYSWKRYRLLLEVAERLGEQAVCPGCNTYGKFKVESSGPAPLPDGGDPAFWKIMAAGSGCGPNAANAATNG